MKLDERQDGDVTILSLEGRLVAGVGDVALRDAVNRVLGEGEQKILVDLSQVSHMDSSGVGELVATRRIAGRFGAKVKFVRGSNAVERVLHVSQILPLFSFYGSVEDALADFESGGELADPFDELEAGAASD
ncbi:MAG TPA: STAS domain-containing protein [Thermoanaerobaculia bacterium]|nr:STAS domain-containing protein [Thermoanaerobaculia bacterium]